MARSLTLTLLLATMLTVAACGGSETGQSERSAPTEPQQTQVESAPQSAPEEATQERVPADDEASGLSVRTIEGEEVRLGGQGDVTALFFMAGW